MAKSYICEPFQKTKKKSYICEGEGKGFSLVQFFQIRTEDVRDVMVLLQLMRTLEEELFCVGTMGSTYEIFLSDGEADATKSKTTT